MVMVFQFVITLTKSINYKLMERQKIQMQELFCQQQQLKMLLRGKMNIITTMEGVNIVFTLCKKKKKFLSYYCILYCLQKPKINAIGVILHDEQISFKSGTPVKSILCQYMINNLITNKKYLEINIVQAINIIQDKILILEFNKNLDEDRWQISFKNSIMAQQWHKYLLILRWNLFQYKSIEQVRKKNSLAWQQFYPKKQSNIPNLQLQKIKSQGKKNSPQKRQLQEQYKLAYSSIQELKTSIQRHKQMYDNKNSENQKLLQLNSQKQKENQHLTAQINKLSSVLKNKEEIINQQLLRLDTKQMHIEELKKQFSEEKDKILRQKQQLRHQLQIKQALQQQNTKEKHQKQAFYLQIMKEKSQKQQLYQQVLEEKNFISQQLQLCKNKFQQKEKQNIELKQKIPSLIAQTQQLQQQIKQISAERETALRKYADSQINNSNKSNNKLLQQQIQLLIQEVFLHKFQGAILHNYLQEKQFLCTEIQKLTKRRIRYTNKLYRHDSLNSANFHKYIDDHRHFCVVIRLHNGRMIAGFSIDAVSKSTPASSSGLILSLTNKKSFNLLNGKRAVTYDDYFLIFGNSELRLKTGELKFFTNFGIANGFFDPNQEKFTVLTGQEYTRQEQVEDFEIFEVIYE